MSFSTDLDAARERAGLPVVYRLECRRHQRARTNRLITIDPERAKRFIGQHKLELGDPHTTYLEGPGRFRIKRHNPITARLTSMPWLVKDAERPAVFGHARTHAAAIELVGAMHARPGQHVQVLDDDDEVVAYVTGIVALERFERHVNAPCTVEPVLPDDDDLDWRDL